MLFQIDWIVLLRDLLGESGVEINEECRIIVAEPEYILKMLAILGNSTSRTIGKVTRHVTA